MRIAMGTLAVLAIVAGFLQIPHVTHVVGDFLHPAFHDSELLELTEASTSTAIVGMLLGAAAAIGGIAIATQLWLKSPATPARLQASMQPLHTLLSRKYFIDEAIVLLIVRPFRWLGAVFDRHAERLVAQGAVVGGSTGVIRLASALVRSAQTGSVRAYAAVISSGIGAILLYALVMR